MRRFVDPAILALAIAMMVSVGLHVPAYEVLGVLADDLLSSDSRGPAPTEIDLTVEDEDPLEEPPEDPDEPPEATESAVESEKRDTVTRDEERPRPKRRPKPEEQKEQKEEQKEAEREPQRAQADPAHKLAVTQRSRDPDVERPEDAEYLAEENNRVEEETVARMRNDVRDDAEPSPGPAREGPTEEPGSADETEVAQMREMEGSDAREPTPEESREERPKEVAEVDPSPVPSGEAGAPGAPSEERGGRGPEGAERTARREVRERQGAEPAPRGDEHMVVEDGYGTLRIPAGRAGRREGEAGRGDSAASREQRARAARSGRRGSGKDGRLDRIGPNQRFAWSQLEELYGEERLEEERRAYIRERKSRRQGSNRQERWQEFRAAIENFVPNVKPGNQTALNAAASPFAEYISAVHRRIHRKFADEFLRGLPTWSTSPLANPDLKTKLEIILNRDGTVHRVGVVETSGLAPFDYGAFAAVMGAQPYPEPPLGILSGDGRVYFHWGFYRNQRQCGTFNAEPYILPNPPGTSRPGGGPLQDEPERDGVVPDDADPSWGTDDEEGDGAGEGEGGSRDGEGGEQESPGEDGDQRRRPDREPPRRAPRPGGSAMG
ncbi:MAG: TonB C-terminal domain-containing protein [Myxococcota bacterium]